MKHIHLDMLGGLAGDMFLAASVDADLVDLNALQAALSSLGVGEIKIVVDQVRRGAFSATHIHFEGWDPAEEQDHRYLSTILEMLENSGLSEAVKARARGMFYTLGESEAKVHAIPLEEVHFHECGALDSIFDFVSAAFIIENSGASWSASAVPTGSGTTETDHGTVPLPVPATAAILSGFELIPKDVQAELVTPTGATILKTLRDLNPGFSRPQGSIAAVGYGAGTRDLKAFANVVRFLVLDTSEVDKPEASTPGDLQRDTVVRLACDIDDMNPELLASVDQLLFEAGALDVVRESVWMKKGRQGTRLTVLGAPASADALADLLFEHTSTFGVRVEEVARLKLQREFTHVETPLGAVRVKIGLRNGEVIKGAPEFEDCARLARQSGRPVREVYQAAQAAWRKTRER